MDDKCQAPASQESQDKLHAIEDVDTDIIARALLPPMLDIAEGPMDHAGESCGSHDQRQKTPTD